MEEHQFLAAIDEVLIRAPEQREFIELRTAYVATREGYRFVSGVGDAFLRQVRGLIGQLLGPGLALLGIADCARWIRDFFTDDLVAVADKVLLLDWYHLRVRCAEERPRPGYSDACVVGCGEGTCRVRCA